MLHDILQAILLDTVTDKLLDISKCSTGYYRTANRIFFHRILNEMLLYIHCNTNTWSHHIPPHICFRYYWTFDELYLILVSWNKLPLHVNGSRVGQILQDQVLHFQMTGICCSQSVGGTFVFKDIRSGCSGVCPSYKKKKKSISWRFILINTM